MILPKIKRNKVKRTKKVALWASYFEWVIFMACTVSYMGYSQTAGIESFSSPNPKIGALYSVRDMMRFNYQWKDDPLNEVGIKAVMESKEGKVEISVYAYDPSKEDGKGKRVYYAYSDETSLSEDDYIHKYVLVENDEGNPSGGETSGKEKIPSNDIRRLGNSAKMYLSEQCLEHFAQSYGQKKWVDLRKTIETGSTSTIPNSCVYDLFSQPIIMEIKVKEARLSNFRVPYLGAFDAEKFKHLYKKVIPKFRNPRSIRQGHIIIGAHRGYFRFRPENSISAMEDAIEFGVEMVEADVRVTKDNHLILSHDLDLGRLTSIPNHIKGNDKFMDNGRYMISKMTLCDLRPDLCSSQDEPVKLKDSRGRLTEKIPTFKEALIACRGKVIFDVDKVTNYDLVFKEAEELNMVNQIVAKGRAGSPIELIKKFPKVPWWRFKFTPIYISDISYKDENGTSISTESSINRYLTIEEKDFDLPGIELIYRTFDDILLQPWGYFKILSKNRNVMQFPQYPEVNPGVWNPKQYQFGDFDPRHDHRADWEWVLKAERRPTLLITDRLELLLDLLKKKGFR